MSERPQNKGFINSLKKSQVRHRRREKPADVNVPDEISHLKSNALLGFVGSDEEDAIGFVALSCLSKHY